MGYGYDKDGKTLSYKMGTSNAGMLLKGAKKVPKGTLFFIGQTASSTCAPAPISKTTASSCSGELRVGLRSQSALIPARLEGDSGCS